MIEEGPLAEGVDGRGEEEEEEVERQDRKEERRDGPAEEAPSPRRARLGAVGGPADRQACRVDREDEDRCQEENRIARCRHDLEEVEGEGEPVEDHQRQEHHDRRPAPQLAHRSQVAEHREALLGGESRLEKRHPSEDDSQEDCPQKRHEHLPGLRRVAQKGEQERGEEEPEKRADESAQA